MVILVQVFGGEWKKHLKYPDLDRQAYQVVSVSHREGRGSQSSETETETTTAKQSDAATLAPSSTLNSKSTASMARQAQALFGGDGSSTATSSTHK